MIVLVDNCRPLGEDVFVYLHGDDAVDNVGIQEMPALPSLTNVDVEETPVVTAGNIKIIAGNPWSVTPLLKEVRPTGGF